MKSGVRPMRWLLALFPAGRMTAPLAPMIVGVCGAFGCKQRHHLVAEGDDQSVQPKQDTVLFGHAKSRW